jgi:hypothetical protein
MLAVVLLALAVTPDPPPVAKTRLAVVHPPMVWAYWPGVGMGWVEKSLVEQGIPRPMPGPGPAVAVPYQPAAPGPLPIFAPSRPSAPVCYTDPKTGKTVCPYKR